MLTVDEEELNIWVADQKMGAVEQQKAFDEAMAGKAPISATVLSPRLSVNFQAARARGIVSLLPPSTSPPLSDSLSATLRPSSLINLRQSSVLTSAPESPRFLFAHLQPTLSLPIRGSARATRLLLLFPRSLVSPPLLPRPSPRIPPSSPSTAFLTSSESARRIYLSSSRATVSRSWTCAT